MLHIAGAVCIRCCLQEEVLLSSAVALAVTSLLLNLQKGSGQDYAFACFFLISATLLLRVRWFLGRCRSGRPCPSSVQRAAVGVAAATCAAT